MIKHKKFSPQAIKIIKEFIGVIKPCLMCKDLACKKARAYKRALNKLKD